MELSAYLKQFDRIGVALSGGMYSALLLREAVAALGAERVLALTVYSEFTPDHERDMAARIAQLAGVEHASISVNLLDDPMIRANEPDRCYYCKRRVYGAIREEAWRRSFDVIADGTSKDDLPASGPDHSLLAELDIRSPFLACGMGKAEIRALSQGMPADNLPDCACLATRIPTGTPITLDALLRVQQAEEALCELGFRALRVCVYGEVARIEAAEDAMATLRLREDEIMQAVRACGFRDVQLEQPACGNTP